MICRCPHCGCLFSVTTSDFGQKFVCSSCNYSDVLDSEHLARFELPDRIHVVVQEADGSLWSGPAITILLRRGHGLPPLRTDETGRLTVTKEMFQRAEQDEAETDMMGNKHDPALVSSIEVRVPSTEQGLILAANRLRSGWSILPFEESLYGSMDNLVAAYVPPQQSRVIETYAAIDLTSAPNDIELIVKVFRISQ